jgi:transcriptional regulator with XRE-family HTH domain
MVDRTGFSVSSLSKIENGHLAVTFDKMVTIADALDIELSHLLSRADDSAPNGRRSVTRKGKGEVYRTGQYDYEMLCADLAKKQIIPLVTKIELRSLEEFGPLVRHDGEEFVYVLKGHIELHTEFYEPVTLSPGDGAYFDSSMGHAMTCRGGNGRVLWISTRPGRDGRDPLRRGRLGASQEAATPSPVVAARRRARGHRIVRRAPAS